ncbi:hypothetical protein [Streptomyces sp. NPDC050263]|uniref:hypothetical protein n=1 Tax=Streptomyces sp. NPDC050263 TaxID=3155037 RepID=UPI0034442F1F
MSSANQTEGPPDVGIVTVLPVPRQNGLTPEQVRGAHCVWCDEHLTAAAFDLGRRQGSYMGVYGPWFPRACDSCTRAQAHRVLGIHAVNCPRCSGRSRAYCPDGQALRRLAQEEEK